MSKQKKSTPTANNSEIKNTVNNFEFVFDGLNYKLMLIGIAVIVLGFVLMYGKTDIYDFRKTALAPLVVITGFVIQIFAIFSKKK